MQNVMVSVLDSERAVHVAVHEDLSDAILASVSADPATLTDLRAAMGRYIAPTVIDATFNQMKPEVASCGTDGGHIVIDLFARLTTEVIDRGEFDTFGEMDWFPQSDSLALCIPYEIPRTWAWFTAWETWRETANQRRQTRLTHPPLDTRAVLYGKVAAWLVDCWLETAADLSEPTVQIQDRWLLTPRDDLRGQCPHAVLLENRDAVDREIQCQARNWSRMGTCPPGLPATSEAYRFGGFGSHENLLYHDMVEYLLESLAHAAGANPQNSTAMTRQIEELQQEWLHTPSERFYDESPAVVITQERERLPAVVPEGADHEDDDCPLCQMFHDTSQPVFWQLEGFERQNRFATSSYSSFGEWLGENQDFIQDPLAQDPEQFLSTPTSIDQPVDNV